MCAIFADDISTEELIHIVKHKDGSIIDICCGKCLAHTKFNRDRKTKMEMTPQEAINSILEKAPHILKEDKYHVPMLFIFGEHENAIVLIDFRDTDSKHAAMLTTGRKFAYLRPYCIAFVSEAWMSKTIPPEGKNVSDMPDKEEVLQVVAQNMEGEIKAATIPFSRIGKEILLGESMESSEVESYLLELFWRGVRESSY